MFLQNDESKSIIIHDGQKHYRKYLSVGRYLTLLGEIAVRRVLDYVGNFLNTSDFLNLIHSEEDVSEEAVTLAIGHGLDLYSHPA